MPETPVTELPQVGPQRAHALAQIGILSIRDLLWHIPREYTDKSQLTPIAELRQDSENTFVAQIDGIGEDIRIKNLLLTRVRIRDETGWIYAVWYNQAYRKRAFRPYTQYLFCGMVQKKYGALTVISPSYELDSPQERRLTPVYPLGKGVTQGLLSRLISKALDNTALPECIPESIRNRYALCPHQYAMQQIHAPSDRESLAEARKRLVFEELFLFQCSLFHLKATLKERRAGIVFKDYGICKKMIQSLPFALTHAQERVLEEIRQDMTGGLVMNRLVQGDVGSGKTAVAMVAAFWAIQNGYQAILMAPTEVLARQHMDSFTKAFAPFDIAVVLLCGSQGIKEKRETLARIAQHDAHMIIGTHAVLQKNVMFARPGLVITDEQHRFGVKQRGMLSGKGENPHVLVMSATPIPRTLGLILYGDLDISIIDAHPPGRQKIRTFAVGSSYRDRMYGFLQKESAAGGQIYIVCPTIDIAQEGEKEAVLTYAKRLAPYFSEKEVAILHGQMKPVQKQAVMEDFFAGNIRVLISTTVIEVGIHVAAATVMVIENAESFGLSQLHQLRGRVGRGERASYCILVSDAKGSIAKERLKAMTEHDDGFVLSELDLKLRGPGDFFGTRQHGLPQLRIANLYQDAALLKEAQHAAQEVLREDPFLEKPEHLQLQVALNDWKKRTERIEI